MNTLNRFLLLFVNTILYWLSLLIPKNKNIWMFGAWMGEKYADNSKYLFEYVNKEHGDIKCVWITNNKKVIKDLRAKGYLAYAKYSIPAIYYGIKASCSIFVHSNEADVMPFINNGKTKLIQLWHGFPLKKIGLDDHKFTTKEGKIKYLWVKKLIFPFIIEKYDLICSSSEEDKEKFITAFNNKNIVITGYPRNDIFYKELSKSSSKIIVGYFPTFRSNTGATVDFFSDYKFDAKNWDNILKEKNIELKIKLHPVNKPKSEVLDRLSIIENISFLDEIDITSFLTEVDILITDYSSIYFDFLLTNKPIIFYPFDFDTYLSNDRELYYSYNEVTPGAKCYNWEEVLDRISYISSGKDEFKIERNNLKSRFHCYEDGLNSLRVFNEINKLLHK